MELTAYYRGGERMEIVPARRERAWMDSAPTSKRCLPLRVANEVGWWLLNPAPFVAEWTGQRDAPGVRITSPDGGPRPSYVSSIFGSGILTFLIPYLFRTEPGYNLLARGPANLPKHGIQALEGLTETDWSIATFTMNWMFTFPNVAVRFEAGEPLCQLVPQKRGELEAFEPKVVQMGGPLQERYDEWREARNLQATSGETLKREWRGAYARGRFPDEEGFEEHQSRLRLKAFEVSEELEAASWT